MINNAIHVNVWLGCSWQKLPNNNVALNEGNSVGSASGLKLEECKKRCSLNRKCKSFSFKADGGKCGLKDKILDGMEPKKFVRGYDTYYKPAFCNGNTVSDY